MYYFSATNLCRRWATPSHVSHGLLVRQSGIIGRHLLVMQNIHVARGKRMEGNNLSQARPIWNSVSLPGDIANPFPSDLVAQTVLICSWVGSARWLNCESAHDLIPSDKLDALLESDAATEDTENSVPYITVYRGRAALLCQGTVMKPASRMHSSEYGANGLRWSL